MKNPILFLTISILAFSCKESQPKWAQKGFNEQNIKYTNLELTEAKINNIPFYSNRSTFTKEFGEPIDSIKLHTFTWEQIKNNHSDSILYTLYRLKNIHMMSALGTTKLTFVDLHNTKYQIETEEFGILSNNTKLKTIKKQASESYEMRNQPLEMSECEFPPITEDDINNGLVIWLKFNGSKIGSCDDLEMIFYKEKLAFVKVSGIDLQTGCF